MKHRDFILIETPPTIVTGHAVRVITMMTEQERLDAIRERPDLMFKVIGADEKDRLTMGEAEQLTPQVNDKGISIQGLSLPVDLEKMLEEL